MELIQSLEIKFFFKVFFLFQNHQFSFKIINMTGHVKKFKCCITREIWSDNDYMFQKFIIKDAHFLFCQTNYFFENLFQYFVISVWAVRKMSSTPCQGILQNPFKQPCDKKVFFKFLGWRSKTKFSELLKCRSFWGEIFKIGEKTTAKKKERKVMFLVMRCV